MMTENEFKLHLSVYLDNKIAAMRAITARLKEDSSDTLPKDEDSMEIMDLLKSIHTNVRVIKRYVVERDPALANYL